MATRKTTPKSAARGRSTTAKTSNANARSGARSTRTSSTSRSRAVREPAVVTEVETVEIVETADTAASSLYNRYPVAALIGEFLGTFLFVAFAIAASAQPLAVFFGLIAVVLLVGRLSGPHLNPAVSIGAWLTRLISGRTAVFYIIAQILGALAAFGILSLLAAGATTTNPYTGASAPAALYAVNPLTAGKEWYTFASEIIGSIILGFGVATALVSRNAVKRGLLYGGTVLLAGSITFISGAVALSNPVLAGGLQAYTHINWSTFNLFPVLVYVIAPVVGVSLGFGLYRLIQRASVSE